MPNEAAHAKHNSTETANNGSDEKSSTSNLTSKLSNGVEVEKRLRKELLDLGILDANDFPKVNLLTEHSGIHRFGKCSSLSIIICIGNG